MLSRVADSLYWMSRYIERAENLARLLDVNLQFLLDAQEAGRGEMETWLPILNILGIGNVPEPEPGKKGNADVAYYLACDVKNPDSIIQCVSHARENARAIRDQLSEELWYELNSISLFLTGEKGRSMWRHSRSEWCTKVIRFSLLFQGLTNSTILYSEGRNFIQFGKYLERADKVSRIADLLTYGKEDNPPLPHSEILRSCSGLFGFRNEFGANVSSTEVADFLLFSAVFPRSIRFCLDRLNESLHAISGMAIGHYSNEVERLVGSLQGELNFKNISEVEEIGLHEFIDDLQSKLNDVGSALFETYVLLPGEIEVVDQITALPTHFFQAQQEQQQQ